jgi:hypothetical protein
MSSKYKLIHDLNTNVLEVFTEQANKDEPKRLYLEGIFGVAGKRNKNNRIYDVEEMKKDIERYNKEFISANRAYNELNHPSSPDVDLERACDRTVSLRLESDGTIYGKALVLETPLGKIQQALIEGGGSIGKSSRAMGQIRESSSGVDYVDAVRIVCFDSVQDPSVGSAIVDPLLEQKEWIMDDGGHFMESSFNTLESRMKKLPTHDKEAYIVESVINFINSIKSS